jgi:hypothetical protein
MVTDFLSLRLDARKLFTSSDEALCKLPSNAAA